MCIGNASTLPPSQPPSLSGAVVGAAEAQNSSEGSRWQDQYAKPGWKASLTKLTPDEETKFQAWALENKAPVTEDYDMRGFWKNGGESSVNHNDGQIHYTDTYKTPLHESFSGESVYSRKDVATPRWNDKDQLVAPNGRVLFDEPAVVAERRKKADK